jgi:A/G-specific adenine glycosylase
VPAALLPEAVESAGSIQAALLAWFDAQQVQLPWRQGRDAYAVLVSEFMLQQTQRERVVPKYREFMLRFPNLATLAAASTADVIRAWAGLGYNSRALRLQQIARRLCAAGEPIPAGLDRLRDLPGVGDYTARAVSCFGYDQPVACVDTNVRRVLGRICSGLVEAREPAATSLALAERMLVRERAADWNAALMDLGALICRARTPACERCPVARWCTARPAFQEASDAPLRRVAEPPASYRAGGAGPRSHGSFAASDRYLRGRIVAVLRSLSDGVALPIDDLAREATGMGLPPQTERVQTLVDRLVHEGLVVVVQRCSGEPAYQLPT